MQSTFCACMRGRTKEKQPTGKLLSLRGALYHGDPAGQEKLRIELRATEIGGGISSLRTTISLTYLFYLRSTRATSYRVPSLSATPAFSKRAPSAPVGNTLFFLTDCSLMTADTAGSVDICFVNRNELVNHFKYQQNRIPF